MFGRAAWWVGGVAVLVGAVFAACGGDSASSAPVSRAEAELELARVAELAASSTPEELCRAPGVIAQLCGASMDIGGTDPSSPPVVVGERRITPEPYPATILEVCGRRADGTVYFTDFIVYREDGELRVRDPVYWSGVSVGEIGDGELTAAPQLPDATPPACP